ncbi:PREDICTED: putative UPF0481 protein At3g02645 [Ipomoea nil]|uniref:putative UPF0481 protein At3g02645 n=1 Tax=Ipomoea nil TaxID=35883 RepID=UPI000900C9F4|nr:PREDICTED: putative UPF0481 protein At3g02645 [Ipomoea nil]
MSSFQPRTASKPDETRWIIHIKESFIQELEEDTVTPATIFNVPKVLMASDPLSYTPQQVAIGPYHYWRPELYEMEKYKLDAAKRYSKLLPEGLKFQELVDKLVKKRVPRIRASYDKYLSINDETLAWMVIMDACFLLEFLCVYAVKEGVIEADRLPGRTSHMVDVSGRKSAHNVMLRDIVMLENQIPLFVLRKLLKWEFSSKDLGDERLFTMLSGLCKDLSPLVNIGEEDMAKVPLDGCAHLLDFLYKVMVPDMDEPCQETRDFEGQSSGNIVYEDDDGEDKAKSLGDSSNLKRLVQEIWKILSKIKSVPTDVLNVIVNLPWDVIGNLPGVKNLKQRLFPTTQGSKKSDDDGSETPPLLEEISIPSVYKLVKSGVQFSPTDSGISTIAFDSNTTTLYLPVINLDVNSQVVLRNMVAYESCIAGGPLVFTRYTELMNGIIDSENDTNVLTEKGILLNHLKNDEEVAKLWNGMSKSIRLTKVPLIDKTIGDVNKYYNGKWKVKAGKFMKSYIYASWKILTVLATILLLVLLTLQSFCSVYSCPRLFNINTTS